MSRDNTTVDGPATDGDLAFVTYPKHPHKHNFPGNRAMIT
jgi:hypothetical protein